ncbi:MAG: hypothetical protein AB9856_01470 [Cellulosilyticaceae bacterium]
MANKKRVKTKLSAPIRSIAILACLLVLFTLSIGLLKQYQNPGLQGKWLSKETGEVVEFKKDGTVVLEDSVERPSYKLISSERMEYNIKDKTFLMPYALQGRALKWGLNTETMEIFNRK